MKTVYTHENKILVEIAKNFLSQHGIESVIQNEYLSGGMGELPAITTWPELCVVSDQDYAAATSLITVLLEGNNKKDWKCRSCQELNASSFELCWNCQRENSE